MRDYYWLLRLAIIVVLALLVTDYLFPHAFADNTTGSYVITDEPVYIPHPHYRLPEQGAVVYINDTVDISGQGWGSGIAWYGKYGEYAYPYYIYTFSPYPRDVRNFYLDPKIFAGKAGMWYQYYGNDTERNGNLAAFYLREAYRNQTISYPNGTVIESGMLISNVTMDKIIPKPSVLPEVHVSDYLLAHGDSLQTNYTRMWVFGRVDSIYAHEGNLSIPEVESLTLGSYKLVSQEAGVNTILEVGYDPQTHSFTSPWKRVQDVSIYGSQPMLDIDRFYQMIQGGTDDKIQTYNMEIEEPAVSIVSIDEVDVGSRIPIAWEPGMTLLDIRGYSNAQNDTEITLVMDPDTQTVRTLVAHTYTTRTIKTSPGNKSMYQVYIPINKNQMPNGIHTITVTTAIGGNMHYNFPISELPPDSYVPNATLKYIGDENPWKPNLTIPDPIVIVNTVTVIQTITIPVTPSQESVDAAQTKALMDTADYYTRTGVSIIGIVAIVYFAGRFLYRVYQKRRWYRK